MANHLSSEKRIRQTIKRREHNRFYGKTMRNAIKNFRALENKEEASKKITEIYSLIDKTAKRGIIHKNKAANLKSKLSLMVAKM